MPLGNLQILYQDNPQKPKFILHHRLYCIRQTHNTLELLHLCDDGAFRVAVVRGRNLGLLRRAILAGTVFELKAGTYPPGGAGITVESITRSPGWCLPKETLPPDPNPVPPHMLQFETGTTRDLWSHAMLDAFAVSAYGVDRFLFQFKGDYSYILTPYQGQFVKVLTALKQSNLDPGMVNKFSAAKGRFPNLPGVANQRFVMETITISRRNHAADGAWDVVMDFRGRTTRPQVTMGI